MNDHVEAVMNGKKVLLVDNDAAQSQEITMLYRRAGAEVFSSGSAVEAFQKYLHVGPDLILIIVESPDGDGMAVCRQFRGLSDAPIIMLTSRMSDEDEIRGFMYGADEFIKKPYHADLLLARSSALIRRTAKSIQFLNSQHFQDEYLIINLDDHRVIVGGHRVRLSTKEFELLKYLVCNPDRVLTFEQILKNVWGVSNRKSESYVHVYVSHLRKKIEANPRRPRYLLNEHGIGYRFHVPASKKP